MLLVLLIAGWATTYSVPLQAGDEASDVTVADGSASFLLSVKMPNKNGINYVYYSTDSNYGYLYGNDTIYVSEGENVYISYNLNSGYKRKSITVNGEVKNNSNNSFEFVMPSSNVEIVIDTEFDPSSPTDPQPADTTKYYNLALACNPSGAGSVSGKGKYAFGKSANVSTSNNSGYVFKC